MKLSKLIFTVGALALAMPLVISCGGKKMIQLHRQKKPSRFLL